MCISVINLANYRNTCVTFSVVACLNEKGLRFPLWSAELISGDKIAYMFLYISEVHYESIGLLTVAPKIYKTKVLGRKRKVTSR